MEEAGDAIQRAVISLLKEEATAWPMEEAGGIRPVARPFQRLLGVSQRTRSTMLI